MADIDEPFGSQPAPDDQDLATQVHDVSSGPGLFTQLPHSPPLKRPFDDLRENEGPPEELASQAEKRQRRNDAILALLPTRDRTRTKSGPSDGPASNEGATIKVQALEHPDSVAEQLPRLGDEPVPSALAVPIDIGGSHPRYLSVEYDPDIAGSEAEAVSRALGYVIAERTAADKKKDERIDPLPAPESENELLPPPDEQLVLKKLEEFDMLCEKRHFENAANLLRGCTSPELEAVLTRTRQENAAAVLPFLKATGHYLEAIYESENRGLEYFRKLKNMDLRPPSGINPRMVLEYPLGPHSAWEFNLELDPATDLTQSPGSDRSAPAIPWSSSPPRPVAYEGGLLRPLGDGLPPDSSCSMFRGEESAATVHVIDNQVETGPWVASARSDQLARYEPLRSEQLPNDDSSSDLEMVEPHAYGEAVDPIDPPSSPPRPPSQPAENGYRVVETPYVKAQSDLPPNSSSPIAADRSLTSPEMLIPGTRDEAPLNDSDGLVANAYSDTNQPQSRQSLSSPHPGPQVSRESSQKKTPIASTSDPWRFFSQTELSQSPSQALRQRRRDFFREEAEQQAREELSNSTALSQPPSQTLRERRQQFFAEQTEQLAGEASSARHPATTHLPSRHPTEVLNPEETASADSPFQQAEKAPEPVSEHASSPQPLDKSDYQEDAQIYKTYKQAYPHYSGTPAHFAQLCALLHRSPDALHPSLWDDFVAVITLHRHEGIANAASDPLDYYHRATDEPACREHVLGPENIRNAAAATDDRWPGAEPQTQAQPGQQESSPQTRYYPQSAQHKQPASRTGRADGEGTVAGSPQTQSRIYTPTQTQQATQAETDTQMHGDPPQPAAYASPTHRSSPAQRTPPKASTTADHHEASPTTRTVPIATFDGSSDSTSIHTSHTPHVNTSNPAPHANHLARPDSESDSPTSTPQPTYQTITTSTSTQTSKQVGHASGFAAIGVPFDADAGAPAQHDSTGSAFRAWAVAFAGLRVHRGALGVASAAEDDADTAEGRVEGAMLLARMGGGADVARWDL